MDDPNIEEPFLAGKKLAIFVPNEEDVPDLGQGQSVGRSPMQGLYGKDLLTRISNLGR